MAYKDIEKRRANQKKWREANPEKEATRRKRFREENPDYHGKHYQELRDEADGLLGNECFFCGRTRKDTKRLAYHKKDGQPHMTLPFRLIRKNPDDWVLLCLLPCHTAVHWLMRVWNMSWEEIEKQGLNERGEFNLDEYFV